MQRPRWGILTNLNFIQLSSESEFALPNRTVRAKLTWSGMLGFEYRLKPWLGLDYDVTHYGPIFSANLHWVRR